MLASSLLKRCSSALLMIVLLVPLGASAASSSSATTKSVNSTQLDTERLWCLRRAIETRETEIMKALNSFYTQMASRLENRRSLLKTAMEITDGKKRRSSVMAIWKNFGFSWKTHTEGLRTAMRTAWQTYRTGRSDCKIAGYDEESGGLGMDSQF